MAKFSENNHKKQSFIITIFLFVVLFALLLLLKYNTQPMISNLEGGGGGGEIAVNFGNSDQGSGDNTESLQLQKSVSKPVPAEKIEQEEIITNTTEAEVPEFEITKKPKEIVKKPAEKPVEKPKPSKATTDALSNLINGTNSKEGDGNDKQSGNKGKTTGSPNDKGYNGGGGTGDGYGPGKGPGNGPGDGIGNSGNGGGYLLGTRKVLKKPIPNYVCNEVGSVVVQITVDQFGNVIDAKPGVKGTTNSSKCLLDESKSAALKTKWQSDSNSPDKQIGKIIYVFKLN